ncbi:hypothetical protein LA080_009285 [Diaporthe eres]|nr:hypothetical protein LA080_009285 [Diaporthe eres]
MAQDYQAVMAARMGQDESNFLFLSLPPEIRNIIYRQALVQYPFISSMSQPALLRTNKQIRAEAFEMYYAQNEFYLIMIIPSGEVHQRIQKFVLGMPKIIEKHVRAISFSIHQKLGDLDPYNDRLLLLLRHLPFCFILTNGRVGNSPSGWTNYSSARSIFLSRLLTGPAMIPGGLRREFLDGVYDRVLLPRALELFNVVWLLAHTFPQATKAIYTRSHLPSGRAEIVCVTAVMRNDRVQHLEMFRSNIFPPGGMFHLTREQFARLQQRWQSNEVPEDRMLHAAPAAPAAPVAPAPKLFARRQEPVSHLLRLPKNLRILIYHYALVAEATPGMRAQGITQVAFCSLVQPALALVNRKLRDECLPLFYANNNFSIAVQSGPACNVGIPEDMLARVLESYYMYWNGFPRESNLRSLRAIRLTWGPSPFIATISYRLADLVVSFGHPIKSEHARRLQVVRWSQRGVEEAVHAAVRQSLRSWPASRRYKLMLDVSGLRPIMNIVWLLGNNCPEARRRIDLCTSVEDISSGEASRSNLRQSLSSTEVEILRAIMQERAQRMLLAMVGAEFDNEANA